MIQSIGNSTDEKETKWQLACPNQLTKNFRTYGTKMVATSNSGIWLQDIQFDCF